MLSKQIDYDDGETTLTFINHLSSRWGPLTFDRFANDANNEVSLFNSKYYCPNTQGVNAFHFSWANHNSYLLPPVYLIPRAIRHLESCTAKGVLVAPFWRSAAFYPIIFNRNREYELFVKDVFIIEDGNACVQQGKNPKCFIGSNKFVSSIIAMKICFEV